MSCSFWPALLKRNRPCQRSTFDFIRVSQPTQNWHAPANPPSTLNSISNLALLLSDQGKLGEAEPLYREALDGLKRTLGDEHPSTLNSLFNFAGLLLKQGHRDQALALFAEELAALRRTLGDAHPSTQQSQRNYARLTTP